MVLLSPLLIPSLAFSLIDCLIPSLIPSLVPSLSPSLTPSFRSRDIKEEKMANILRYIERQLGREVHLERDGMGRWAIPHELVASSGIPFDQ